jgi:Family of unknown function (DUF6262)
MEQKWAAISRLEKNQQPINFRSVSTAAAVSPAWLYKEEGIRREIERLRGSQSSAIQPPRLGRSKDNIIAALRLRAKAPQERNRDLIQELETVYGRLAALGSECEHSEVEDWDRSEL